MKKDGNWHMLYFCKHCKEMLVDGHQVGFSDGVCPWCGHQNKSTGRISREIEHTKRIGRWVRPKNISAWNFDPNKGHWEYKDEEALGK